MNAILDAELDAQIEGALNRAEAMLYAHGATPDEAADELALQKAELDRWKRETLATIRSELEG